jgi:Domain of unknown function (DUF4153)
MSFFSQLNLSGRYIEIIKRFPVVIFFAVATTFTLLVLIDDTTKGDIIRWPICGFIGFLAMLNWSLAKEAYKLSRLIYWIGVGVIIAALGVYYFMIPTDFDVTVSCFWYFTVGLSLILHFLISIIPFLKTRNNHAFTAYNVHIFISWMQSALYSIIFYTALSLAILALDNLFDIKLDGIIYFKLFILVTGLLQTTFFLSEIPDQFYDTEVPAQKSIFKIITSYVFIPICIIYGLILYAYMLRVLITGTPMVDWAYVMVLWYFVVGISSWLFAGYYDNAADNTLMSKFRKYFFLFSILPAILLFLSLYQNISWYGIKEEYYLSAAVAIFIAITTVYMLVSKIKDKRVFPLLLMVLSLETFMGSSFSICKVPVRSQQKKLIHDLETRGIISGGVIQIDTSRTYSDTNGIVSNKLYYLQSRNALGYIKQFDKNNLIKIPADSISAYHLQEIFRLDRYTSMVDEKVWNVYFSSKKPVDIVGYEKIIPVKYINESNEITDYIALTNEGQINLYINKADLGRLDVNNDIFGLSNHPDGSNIVESNLGEYKIRIIVESASGEKTLDKTTVTSLQAIVLIKKDESEQ